MYEPTEAETEEAKKVIPYGLYCYAVDEARMATRQADDPFYIIPCPYWSRDENLLPQEDGCCSFLKTKARHLILHLLWDQVKECGLNVEEEVEVMKSCRHCKGSGVDPETHYRYTSGTHDDRRCEQCNGSGLEEY